jgi:OOP family OmpA-OmpF porin
MGRILVLAVALLAISSPLYAQNTFVSANLTGEQIVKELLPNDSAGPTRGIRLSQPPVSAAAPPAQVARPPSVNFQVNFPTGSAELTPIAAKTLDSLGEALNDARLGGNKFRIEGHTDTVGAPDANKALSDRRAKAVAEYLIAKHKVEPARLSPVGMGQEDLAIATPAGTPELRNRRVTVVNLGS